MDVNVHVISGAPYMHTRTCIHAEKLVRQGVMPVVLSSMVSSARCGWCTDDILHLYHSLLLQLGSKG